MKLIAHRGNTDGPNLIRENSVDYIEEAISEGFDVEIDLRVEDNECYLGHDDPQYFVTIGWLRKYKDVLWIHCKNREALEKMSSSVVEFNYFWHENDCYTITSKGVGWIYPGKEYVCKSVIVMPEWNISVDNISKIAQQEYFGICSDYVKKINYPEHC